MVKRPARIMVVAGESSGDWLGAGLIRALRKLHPDAVFFGVGGEAMAAEGVRSCVPLADLAVMGLVEVAPALPKILGHMDTVLTVAAAEKIDLLVTIDSPDFTLRVAKKAKTELGIPCIHYVSPHVWAWRRGRIRSMAKYLDHVLALFPFEPDVYRGSGLACTYVGHPVGERLAPLAPTSTHKPLNKPPCVAICPGSRRSEITRMMPVMMEAVERLYTQHPGIKFVMPLADTVNPRLFEPLVNMNMPITFIRGEERYTALKDCDAAMATSGTVNLELAMLGLPMVVGYRLSPITYILAKALVKIDHFSPVNLVAQKRLVPELLQHEANGVNLAGEVNLLITNTPERETQLQGIAKVRHALMGEGEMPSLRAARVVSSYLTAALKAAKV